MLPANIDTEETAMQIEIVGEKAIGARARRKVNVAKRYKEEAASRDEANQTNFATLPNEFLPRELFEDQRSLLHKSNDFQYRTTADKFNNFQKKKAAVRLSVSNQGPPTRLGFWQARGLRSKDSSAEQDAKYFGERQMQNTDRNPLD